MAKYSAPISLPVSFFKEGKYFIAYSPALDLSTSGGSFEQVKIRFTEIVEIFFEELTKKGTLDDVLTGLGWKKKTKAWAPPLPIAHEQEKFRIPLMA